MMMMGLKVNMFAIPTARQMIMDRMPNLDGFQLASSLGCARRFWADGKNGRLVMLGACVEHAQASKERNSQRECLPLSIDAFLQRLVSTFQKRICFRIPHTEVSRLELFLERHLDSLCGSS